MPKQDNRKQVSQYDKIIKENLEVTLPVIIRDVLGLDILVSEELPDDVQHTKERKPDALKKVTDTLGKEDSYRAVMSIIDGIQSITKGDFAGSRYFKQLRIFVQLRSSVEQQFEKAMETVTKFFKEENDFLYRKGEAKGETIGEAKKSHAVVENLIVKLGFTDEQAADVAEVDVEYVKKVRAELKK